MGTFNNNSTWGKILNILITILTALATTFGAQNCMWIKISDERRANFAIKWEQSQACLSYAEQKQNRRSQ